MSDAPNNPVTQQPQRSMSRTAHLGIMAAMTNMGAGATPWLSSGQRLRRHGKHNGRNAGAFGKKK